MGRVLRSKYKSYATRRGERGVSLFFALFAMLFLSSYIIVNINVDRERVLRERADQTAWLVNEIAQAARLYVRDQTALGTAAFQKTALCANPQLITVNNLVAGGYIGPNVGNRNAGNANFLTPFGQTITIVAANSRINNAACAPTDLTDVATSAYLILQPPAAPIPITGNTINTLASYLTSYGLPVVPPVFDALGNNVSNACGAGGPATVQWDTGCLTNAQYAFLMPAVPFAANTIGVPAWLSMRGDNRAVFRYEQAENPLAQTMQTDLRMAPMVDTNTTTCTQVPMTVAAAGADPTATANVPSGVCSVMDDTATVNNRRDVTNLSALAVNRALVTPQAVDNGAGDAATPLRINGDVQVTGNVRSYAPANSFTASNINMTGTDPGFTVAARPGAPAPAMTFTGNINTGVLQATNGSVSTNTTVSNATTANNNLAINGSSTVTGGGRGVVVNRLGGNVPNLTIAGEAVIGGRTQVGDTATVNGGGLAFATARLDAKDAEMKGLVKVGNDISSQGATSVDVIQSTASSVNRCLGDCPDRQPEPEPPL